ncbi:MAG: sigma-70 family RNA polymerase sigma factor [Verrucomicrobiales bacterium]|nr:sigma-70 family RNA polymerase sigma factor [Verrucomicrobiales bacterium]
MNETELVTRRSLLSRIKNFGDNASWNDFDATYRPLIFRVALNAELSREEAEEVAQDTIFGLAQAMPEFKYDPARCRFKSFVQKLARRRISDQFRRRKRQIQTVPFSTDSKLDAHSEDALPDHAIDALESKWEQEWNDNLVRAAREKLKQKLKPKQLTIYDYHVIQGKTVAETRKHLRVSVMQVYLAKSRVGSLFRREIERLRDGLI